MGRASHHSKSKVGRRRSQLALSKLSLAVCPQCKGPTLPHRACAQCGTYTRSPRNQSRLGGVGKAAKKIHAQKDKKDKA